MNKEIRAELQFLKKLHRADDKVTAQALKAIARDRKKLDREEKIVLRKFDKDVARITRRVAILQGRLV